MINYNKIPTHMQESVRRYIEDGQAPGSFLLAVLENKFLQAFQCADDDNLAEMRNWANFIYWELPGNAHGSPEKVMAYIKGRQEEVSGLETRSEQ